MTRRNFLTTATAAVAAPPAAQHAAGRPNFLIIYVDDMGIGDLGCYGAADAKTPNLDALAASGARFTSWYSNCPVCSPSRASVLTGKYPQRTGIVDVLPSRAEFDVPGLRENEVTIARALQSAGYSTAAVGKWHLGSAPHSRPMRQGFDQFFGFYSGWTDYYSHRYYLGGQAQRSDIFHDLWRNNEEAFEDPGYQTEILTREANAFLSKQSTAKPFFLYLAYGAPHYPMMAPKRYLDRFAHIADRDRRMHNAVIACIDDAVGELMKTLRARGLERNTVIFFQSDNGATEEARAHHAAKPYRGGSNAPFRGYKTGLWEGGIRMPAFMSWPARIAPKQVIDHVGIAMDIPPTFAKMAGLPAFTGIDGLDVTAMVTQRARSPHEAIFWSYKGQSAMRLGDWKLMVNPRAHSEDKPGVKIRLSNLKHDPGEKMDFAEPHPEKVRELMPLLSEWEKQWTT